MKATRRQQLTICPTKLAKVVNDTTERGVKLAEDYATILTKNDAIRVMILQRVERNRSKYPDFNKGTLDG